MRGGLFFFKVESPIFLLRSRAPVSACLSNDDSRVKPTSPGCSSSSMIRSTHPPPLTRGICRQSAAGRTAGALYGSGGLECVGTDAAPVCLESACGPLICRQKNHLLLKNHHLLLKNTYFYIKIHLGSELPDNFVCRIRQRMF